ncbi:MAG: isopropylmalate/homocitrate/citramalate synthase [Rhodobacteraceae bacterium]|nr:isopropylmalate/homocitrate/citramalate synthase [Paracoccaceae bacterium]
MTRDDATALIARYYAAFNAGDGAAMLACVSDDIEHRVNQGGIRRGRALFAEFCGHMGVSYQEELKDLVIFASEDGRRGAAEFVVHGRYLQTDPGLPAAHGQTYILPAGGFFDLADGKITRVSTYYNLADWIAQVSA